MSLIFCSQSDDSRVWKAAFADCMPELEFRVWPDFGERQSVEIALVWDPMQDQLLEFPNLKAEQTRLERQHYLQLRARQRLQ